MENQDNIYIKTKIENGNKNKEDKNYNIFTIIFFQLISLFLILYFALATWQENSFICELLGLTTNIIITFYSLYIIVKKKMRNTLITLFTVIFLYILFSQIWLVFKEINLIYRQNRENTFVYNEYKKIKNNNTVYIDGWGPNGSLSTKNGFYVQIKNSDNNFNLSQTAIDYINKEIINHEMSIIIPEYHSSQYPIFYQNNKFTCLCNLEINGVDIKNIILQK